MQALRALSAVVLFAALSACATMKPSGPPPVLGKLQAMGVSKTTYAKIENHRVLTYADILGLLKKDVPSQVILTYIRSTHAPYKLTDSQLEALDDAGADSELVNYLGQSSGYFEATERSQTGGAGKWKDNPFFNDPYYMGPAPFAYEWPDEWYDAGWMDGVF